MTSMHHIRRTILLGSWCWLNVPVDWRMSTFLYPSTWRGCVTLLTPGTSETLHTVTKFLHGLIKTLGIFLYIFVTILYFILLERVRKGLEYENSLSHAKRLKINKVGLHCLCGWPKISRSVGSILEKRHRSWPWVGGELMLPQHSSREGRHGIGWGSSPAGDTATSPICFLSLFSDIRTILILQFAFVLKTINKVFKKAETLKRKLIRQCTREYKGYIGR